MDMMSVEVQERGKNYPRLASPEQVRRLNTVEGGEARLRSVHYTKLSTNKARGAERWKVVKWKTQCWGVI